MTYNPSIPLITDALSTSQPQIKNNFNQLNVQFGVDHSGFNVNGSNGTGFHNKVTWPDQTSSPPTSASGQVVAYGITNNSVTMPYYKRDGLSTVFPLAPIKAYAVWVSSLTPNGTVTLDNNFNIASITQVGLSQWTITLTNACRNTVFGVLAFSSLSFANSNLIWGGINSSSFTVSYSPTVSPGFPIFLTAVVLET